MTKAKGVNFETALKKLKEIVEELESDDLDLEKSLSRFEEGINLVKLCSQHLDEAEKKVEILTAGRGGKAVRFEIEEGDGDD
ncbi:MAG: exodeoxyribonuclease VII small subunit [Nitrospinae bacterium]|nr:exodeoxyribonuclease VII small subunit [Nitrospinota bacterium]